MADLIAEQVARYKASCRICGGTGLVATKPCRVCTLFEPDSEFTRRYFANVPPHYWGFFLSNLQPTDKVAASIERQQEITAMLRAKPDASYAFFGPAGTGKTAWLMALWAENAYRWMQEAARRGLTTKWFPVRLITARKLLDQFNDWTLRKNEYIDPESDRMPVDPPDINREKIERWSAQGVKPRLFLEELTKIGRETETRRTNLYDVIDAVYTHEGQLVIACNLTPQQFEEEFGDVLARRISEMGTIVNLFQEKK